MKLVNSLVVRLRFNPRGWVADPFRAAPVFTPSTIETRGGCRTLVPQKVRVLTLFLAQPQSSNVQATPYFPNTHDSLSLAPPICSQPPTP
jgi:hypothetical protein